MEKDIVLLIAGFVVGAMNAIAGGGMLVGFPILIALGVPPIYANATGAVITAPGQLTSALGYWRYLRRVPLRFAWFILPIILGAVGGSLTLRHTSPRDFADIVPGLLLFGVLLFALQPYLHLHLRRHIKRPHAAWAPMLLLGTAMVPLSFYGGYFGAGFGFIMLGLLGLTNMPDTHMINAMKNVAAIFVSAATIICLYSTHLIHWRMGLIAAVGSVVGGFAGARSAQHVSNRWLRIVITLIGLVAVTYLAFQQY